MQMKLGVVVWLKVLALYFAVFLLLSLIVSGTLAIFVPRIYGPRLWNIEDRLIDAFVFSIGLTALTWWVMKKKRVID